MGSKPQGWRLVQRGKFWHVRFRHAGRRHFVSTGATDPRKAEIEAARIYADTVSGRRGNAVASKLSTAPLDVAVAKWLATLEGILDDTTLATYQTTYVARWLDRWDRVDQIADEARLADFVRDRLRGVLKKTVRKELSALFGFFGYCVEVGLLPSLPKRPHIRKTVLGVRSGRQRERAPDVSPTEVEKALAALPLWSRSRKGGRHPVRPRFVFGYETGLRPGALNEIWWEDLLPDPAAPESLRIRPEVDKARFGRDVPLSPRAREALLELRAALIASGIEPAGKRPIFGGPHDFRSALRAGAVAAGIPALAPYDLRHARATHLVEAGAPLAAVAWIHGHKQLTTTDRYAKGTERAAGAALAAEAAARDAANAPPLDSDDEPGAQPAQETPSAAPGAIRERTPFRGTGAREGNRTPTSVTPLEPESGSASRDQTRSSSKTRTDSAEAGQIDSDSGARSQSPGVADGGVETHGRRALPPPKGAPVAGAIPFGVALADSWQDENGELRAVVAVPPPGAVAGLSGGWVGCAECGASLPGDEAAAAHACPPRPSRRPDPRRAFVRELAGPFSLRAATLALIDLGLRSGRVAVSP